jgi:16S rRNA (uracil1498-N3)-methyltransferase
MADAPDAPDAPDGGPAPAVPDPRLVAAAAMVFVDDPRVPVVGEADARHLLDVLRLRPGEPVIASDGAGAWVPCRVGPAAAGRSGRSADPTAVLVVDGEPVAETAPSPGLTLAFAPVKGDRPEWVVQKLTELGIDRIVPLLTRRSVVRWEGERARRSVERLRRVARESSAQCRRPAVPEVLEVTTLAGLAQLTGTAPALAHPGGRAPGTADRVVAVGPEGGWDDGELAAADALVGLGRTVLRAETAAVAAGTLLCAFRAALIAPLA